MVSDCMKAGNSFGVILLSEGAEAGGKSQVKTERVGTLATISDWYQGNDGVLGITALGGDRFKLLSTERQGDGLHVAEIEVLEGEKKSSLPAQYTSFLIPAYIATSKGPPVQLNSGYAARDAIQ